MLFDMKCNMCGVTLRVQKDKVGSIINCPSCGQVIFVQLPTEAGGASDTPPVSQETLALHSGPPEPELPNFMKPAEAAAPTAPALAPQTLAETDTVSSLAEMFGGEESGAPTVATQPAPSVVEPQSEPTEIIDLSFLTPKLDTASSLDSSPAVQSAPELIPIAGDMPWEQPVEQSEAADVPPSIFEPQQPAAPHSFGPVASSPSGQPAASDFPWMPAPESDAPATIPSQSLETFDFTAPVTPAQSNTAPPGAAAPPVAFLPPSEATARRSQPDFFMAGAPDESTPALPSAANTDFSSVASVATVPAKPPSRFGFLAGAYVSGVIFGLIIGKFVFGRAVAAAPTGLEAVRDDGVLKSKTKWVDPNAAVPHGQRKRLGDTVEIAGLSITARSIERARVTKVHSFGGGKETSDGECLVLHLLLKNTTRDVEFAPLDPMFVRPHNRRERPTYSFIEVAGGEPIGMFDLTKFSEFDLEGQPFDTLKPGEETEAIIAAAEHSPSKTKGKMHWRLQVRAGVPENKAYTTIVGFEFTPEQIRG